VYTYVIDKCLTLLIAKEEEGIPLPIIKKKVANDEEDDESKPNTYDYNDSFINDESQKRSHSDDEEEEDGSESSEGEDIAALKKEAKKFVKNDKMKKPV